MANVSTGVVVTAGGGNLLVDANTLITLAKAGLQNGGNQVSVDAALDTLFSSGRSVVITTTVQGEVLAGSGYPSATEVPYLQQWINQNIASE